MVLGLFDLKEEFYNKKVLSQVTQVLRAHG